uniref:Uncharacterized protein n=1 Tax=Cacopsylla melanoneura TaxID=428564 RepID=A0A8D8TEZ2_9HEMI
MPGFPRSVVPRPAGCSTTWTRTRTLCSHCRNCMTLNTIRTRNVSNPSWTVATLTEISSCLPTSGAIVLKLLTDPAPPSNDVSPMIYWVLTCQSVMRKVTIITPNVMPRWVCVGVLTNMG